MGADGLGEGAVPLPRKKLNFCLKMVGLVHSRITFYVYAKIGQVNGGRPPPPFGPILLREGEKEGRGRGRYRRKRERGRERARGGMEQEGREFGPSQCWKQIDAAVHLVRCGAFDFQIVVKTLCYAVKQ